MISQLFKGAVFCRLSQYISTGVIFGYQVGYMEISPFELDTICSFMALLTLIPPCARNQAIAPSVWGPYSELFFLLSPAKSQGLSL